MAHSKIKGISIEPSKVMEYWLNSYVFGEKIPPRDSLDFGTDGKAGGHLKRRYVPFNEVDDNSDFGIYLGEHENKWIVGIINLDFKFIGGESFDSLGELKDVWELD